MLPGSVTRSLRAKVTISIVLPLALILGAITAIEQARRSQAIEQNLSSLASYSGQMIEASLRHAMLQSDFAEVQGILNTVGANEDIESVFLLDTEGRIILAPNAEGVGQYLDNQELNCAPCHARPVSERPGSVVVTNANGQQVFRSMHPIENAPECARCHDPDQQLLGLLLTDLSMESVEGPLATELRENVLWAAAAILITILMTQVVINRLVLRRLGRFAPAIDRLREGAVPLNVSVSQPDEIGQLATAFNMMTAQVEQRRTENAALSASLRQQNVQRSQLLQGVITAQEDERRRVARELHDELGQYLGGLALHAEAIERLIMEDAPRAVQQIQVVQALTKEATDRMYDMILDLRPSVLDDLGLAAALRSYGDRLFADSGVVLELDSRDLTRRLPTEMETALYRICQEALCNVMRHAGARRVTVSLRQHPDHFELEIVDDGRGFATASIALDGKTPRGLGLQGMRERVTQCGGDLEIVSAPGSGTRIRIAIPGGGERT